MLRLSVRHIETLSKIFSKGCKNEGLMQHKQNLKWKVLLGIIYIVKKYANAFSRTLPNELLLLTVTFFPCFVQAAETFHRWKSNFLLPEECNVFLDVDISTTRGNEKKKSTIKQELLSFLVRHYSTLLVLQQVVVVQSFEFRKWR